VAQITSFNQLGLHMGLLQGSLDELCAAGRDVLPTGIDVVLFEPFLFQLEQLPLTLALSFWYATNRIREANLLANASLTLPFRCRVRAVAVAFETLHYAYGKQVGDILGMNHAALREMQVGHLTHDFVLPLWQHPFTVMSEVTTIATFDYSQPVKDLCTETSGAMINEGPCHGVVSWLEFSLDRDDQYVISTSVNAPGARQSVRFFPADKEPYQKVSRAHRFYARFALAGVSAESSVSFTIA